MGQKGRLYLIPPSPDPTMGPGRGRALGKAQRAGGAGLGHPGTWKRSAREGPRVPRGPEVWGRAWGDARGCMVLASVSHPGLRQTRGPGPGPHGRPWAALGPSGLVCPFPPPQSFCIVVGHASRLFAAGKVIPGWGSGLGLGALPALDIPPHSAWPPGSRVRYSSRSGSSQRIPPGASAVPGCTPCASAASSLDGMGRMERLAEGGRQD